MCITVHVTITSSSAAYFEPPMIIIIISNTSFKESIFKSSIVCGIDTKNEVWFMVSTFQPRHSFIRRCRVDRWWRFFHLLRTFYGTASSSCVLHILICISWMTKKLTKTPSAYTTYFHGPCVGNFPLSTTTSIGCSKFPGNFFSHGANNHTSCISNDSDIQK